MTLTQKLFEKQLLINNKSFIIFNIFQVYLANLFFLYRYRAVYLITI